MVYTACSTVHNWSTVSRRMVNIIYIYCIQKRSQTGYLIKLFDHQVSAFSNHWLKIHVLWLILLWMERRSQARTTYTHTACYRVSCFVHIISHPDIKIDGNSNKWCWLLVVLLEATNKKNYHRKCGVFSCIHLTLIDHFILKSVSLPMQNLLTDRSIAPRCQWMDFIFIFLIVNHQNCEKRCKRLTSVGQFS